MWLRVLEVCLTPVLVRICCTAHPFRQGEAAGFSWTQRAFTLVQYFIRMDSRLD